MNKNESKYFNTAIKMDEALIALLEKKDFPYITVKEICEKAGVNRSTFYLHYENTTDLLQETTRYILDKHFSYYNIKTQDIPQHLANRGPNELIFISEEYLKPYLTFIKENQRIFKVAIKEFHVMKFNNVYTQMFEQVFNPLLTRFSIPPQNRTYVIKFYLSGITAIVMEWLNGGCCDNLDYIIGIITDCVIGGRNTTSIAAQI